LSNTFVHKTNSRRVSIFLRNFISFYLNRKYFHHNRSVFISISTRRLLFYDWEKKLKRRFKKTLLDTITRAVNDKKLRRNRSSFLITFFERILLIHSITFSRLTLKNLTIIVIMFNSMSRKLRSVSFAFFLRLIFNSKK
jgi:hypothetical protein